MESPQRYSADIGELQWDNTCLETENGIWWEAAELIERATTLEEAKRAIALAKSAIADGKTSIAEDG